jgi:PadR family transcriptional regulator
MGCAVGGPRTQKHPRRGPVLTRPNTEAHHAFLDLALLAVLTEGERHGYALAQRLAEEGLGNVTGGVLYPALGRLEAQGVVTATWQAGEGGPGRKVYELTPAGRDRLAVERSQWRDFTGTANHLLEKTEDKP